MDSAASANSVESIWPIMRKLDGMNIITRTIKTPSKQHQPQFYMGCHFKCSKKCYLKDILPHILLSGNLILTSKRTLRDWFYLEIVSHRAIKDIMQTPKKEIHFFFSSVCCIVFNCSWQITIFGKKQKSCVKRIHLVTDDGS